MTTCRVCGKPIVFAVVSNRQGRRPSRMPLNPAPDPEGNVAAYHDVNRTLTGRVLGKGEEALGYERLMMPHFATCKPQAPAEPPPAPPPGVTSLDEWRRAAAKHNKAKRRRRGKRPAKPITGIRIYPGRQP